MKLKSGEVRVTRFIKSFGLLIALVIGTVLFYSCRNMDGVSPDSRSTFVYYYGGMGNYTATSALQLSDGYLVVGDSISSAKFSIVVIKTNKSGEKVWRKKIDSAVSNSAIVTPTGYMIIGDRMNVDLTQTNVSRQIKRKMRIISLSATGGKLADQSWGADTATNYRGSALTMDASGNLYSVSTVNPLGSSNFAQYASHDPNTLSIQWVKSYNQDGGRNYQNSISAFTTNQGDIIWATSSVAATSITTSTSFLRIPVGAPNAAFVNGASFGQDAIANNKYFSGVDIQATPVGYGIIGTFQTYQQDAANIFFIRTDLSGTPIPKSAIYFDGYLLAKHQKPLSDSTVSLVQDNGTCLAATKEGGFLLAGYTTSTNDGKWGNGGKDVFLIRIDPFGNFIWYKTWGGTGDEVPSTAKQTSDGGFIISGTLTLAGQSSMFLLKTDSNGELKN
ncbi:MAG: hypothetical protein OJF59_002890 [Cytophagales bacterium]|jgi:hypothetical protein|nr:hypothetical protein [Bacteroidota bacterium]WHZ09134.1 MAG: hypothetical protein OJF59_002890 [Cytophagales bacterium]